ncbi:hypothetical protein Y032_0037g3443 [Ancylostoma ceylanicum]|uniref:Uncharacterized protein n=1 Tax=Ancylostoma ceylanicum TaxID=53326 RepID=A0A016UKC2_9BILA|nr:hypothetical protein Y032_0037g3443 [Ancylostoma ceylanicum]
MSIFWCLLLIFGFGKEPENPIAAVQGIHLGVNTALQIRARADPFQQFKSLIERLHASGFYQFACSLRAWSAIAPTFTPLRIPYIVE